MENNNKDIDILDFLNLVPLVLRELHISYNDWEDMYQECVIGLLHAQKGFNPEYGFKFSTYAVACMKQQIIEVLPKNSIIPRNTYAYKMGCELEKRIELCKQKGMTMEEIVRELGYNSYDSMASRRKHNSHPILIDMSLIHHFQDDTYSKNSSVLKQIAEKMVSLPIDTEEMEYENLYEKVIKFSLEDKDIQAFVERVVFHLSCSEISQKINKSLSRTYKMIINGKKKLRGKLKNEYREFFGYPPPDDFVNKKCQI